jgi:hypothetical protein
MTEILTRAEASLSSFDPGTRTVDAVLATENPVRRHDWDDGGYIDEVLVCSADAIDVTRMDSLALLDGHRNGSLDHRLGTVVPGSLRFESGRAIVKIQLSRNPKAEQVFADLADGHTLNVSAGYRILTAEKTTPQAGETATLRATRWEPLELSIVQIPADATATTRNLETPMTTTQTKTRSAADETRIIELATAARMSEAGAEAIRSGESLADFRTRLLDDMASRDERAPIDNRHRTDGVNPGLARADAMTDALFLRVDATHKPSAEAREFVGLSLPELARRCVEAQGVDTRGMSASALITRGLHSTSDFSVILGNVANKRLQAAFAAVPSALKRTARESSARDFKMKTIAKLSAAPDLLKVNEHGEYKRGSMVEAQESYKIETFGRIFGITRQALINDDLGAFASAAGKMGAAASVFEAKTLAALLEQNPVMADGQPVFHATHNNIATAAALDHGPLGIARALFRKQVGLSGDLVDLSPRYLIVPAALETAAEKLLSEITATNTSDSNAFARTLELVVEPRLTNATQWYLSAAPGQCEGLEYSYLEGQAGPYFEVRNGFDVDGMEIKVRLDFGAAFTEHRSWVRNAGA